MTLKTVAIDIPEELRPVIEAARVAEARETIALMDPGKKAALEAIGRDPVEVLLRRSNPDAIYETLMLMGLATFVKTGTTLEVIKAFEGS